MGTGYGTGYGTGVGGVAGVSGVGTVGVGNTAGCGQVVTGGASTPCCGSSTLHQVPLKVDVSVGHPQTVAHRTHGHRCGCGCGVGVGKKDDIPEDTTPEDNDAH